jgi:spore germination protein GerM
LNQTARLLASSLICVTLIAGAAACGSQPAGEPAAGKTDTSASAGFVTETRPTAETTIYFLTNDGSAPIGVRRTIARKSPYAREALKALLAGPTSEEAESGITTAIPDGTRLLSMTYKRHGADETVNLAGLPPEASDFMQKTRIITQIARTLIGVSGIERIWLQANGQPWGLGLMDGGVYAGPWSYDELVGRDVSAGCPGTETVECDHFSALP